MAAKAEFFSEKRSWIWTCSEISRKFRLLRKSATILNEASSYLYTLGNDIYTGKNSSTNIYLFRVNNSNTRKRREICSKLAIMSLQRRSTVFIVNFEYIYTFLHLFLVFLYCWLWTIKCLLGPILSIYKCWNYLLPQVLTDVHKS